jgi:serine phosphatase RsbU (regulator of sigma subunit)/anti-sigma regulatory factor (Ser/Thr protein kinase)
MDRVSSAVYANLKDIWADLSGGGLSILDVGDSPPSRLKGRKIPDKVKEAVALAKVCKPYKTHGGSWWIVRPSEAIKSTLLLLAWSTPDKDWSGLLQSWMDMLAFSLNERTVADNLTEALVDAWDRLTFVYELTHIATQITELPDMLRSIVQLLSEVIAVEEVFLVFGGEGEWNSVTASGNPLPSAKALIESIPHVGRPVGITEMVLALKQKRSPLADVGDLLVAPLVGEGNLSGAIGLIDSHPARFDSNDVHLLAFVSEQVGAIIGAVQAREAQKLRQRLEHELGIAAEIQASLLPLHLPDISGLELGAHLHPARQIGGDFYDVASSKTGDPMLLLADVAGKGSPAAILTAVVHATFRGEALHRRDPGKLLEIMNRLLHPDFEKAEAFVTAVVVSVEGSSRTLSYASAGHTDGLHWKNGEEKVEFLPASGLPLGIDPQMTYPSTQVHLEPGDVLLLYSDGVTEAENPEGKLLGQDGLSDIIYAICKARAEDQIRVILESLEQFRDGNPLKDDVALLMLRALPETDLPVEVIPFVVPAVVPSIRTLVDLVRDLGPNLPVESQDERRQLSDNFALALSEIVINQIQHAYQGNRGQIFGRVIIEDQRLVADLFDNGIPFKPPEDSHLPINLDDPPDRGYGLRLVRGLLDQFECHRLNGVRNHWHLVKNYRGDEKP